MNKAWIEYLTANNATIINNSEVDFPIAEQQTTNSLTALAHLSIIKVAGKDAAIFLQGQLTCNIKELNAENSFFCAFCNAKGRTISTLLILKSAENFLLILPNELVEKVCNKLRMYILRSDVQLENISDELCISGLVSVDKDILATLPKSDFSVTDSNALIIKIPSNNKRYLIIGSSDQSITLWDQLNQSKNISFCNSNRWKYLDISAGIPWLSLISSEDYIPQMLNIDKLGGISFNKGCYTGQEIIARTHYLGKAKRELYLVECDRSVKINIDNQIIAEGKQQSSGKLLSLQSNEVNNRILIIMPTTDAGSKKLMLDNSSQDIVRIVDFQ